METMTVASLIEFLKTLKQDYIIEVGDSEYSNTELTEDSFSEDNGNKRYIIY